MTNVLSFASKKQQQQKISMVTCYDHWSARILADTDVDCLLVGDSVAVVMHGFPSTVHATVDMIAMHTAAVARGAPGKFVIADMPFLSCSAGIAPAMDAVRALVQAGASAVKIEGADHQAGVIRHIVEAGVPVMGHLGLTPQSIHNLGGHKVQARSDEDVAALMAGAERLQQAGCFALVLECVPARVGECVTRSLSIPTIGIGAGVRTDGQVLVLQDLLGADPTFNPKFLRKYADSHGLVRDAVTRYHDDVVAGAFPAVEESYR